MSHPMYSIKTYASAYAGYKKDPAYFYEVASKFGDQAIGMELHILTMDHIAKGGNIVIDIEGEDWESDISAKTLSGMRPTDIKFPFTSGAIMDKKINSGFILFSIIKGFMNFSFEIMLDDGSLGVQTQRINMADKIEDAVEFFSIGTDEIYRSISVLMYIAAFRREKSRVIEGRTQKLKASKKRSIPTHRIHTILVRQPKISREGAHHGGHSKSNMSWIVKGHWRNQWYSKEGVHKLKWLDSYFKGKGKEEISKVYKVS